MRFEEIKIRLCEVMKALSLTINLMNKQRTDVIYTRRQSFMWAISLFCAWSLSRNIQGISLAVKMQNAIYLARCSAQYVRLQVFTEISEAKLGLRCIQSRAIEGIRSF